MAKYFHRLTQFFIAAFSVVNLVQKHGEIWHLRHAIAQSIAFLGVCFLLPPQISSQPLSSVCFLNHFFGVGDEYQTALVSLRQTVDFFKLGLFTRMLFLAAAGRSKISTRMSRAASARHSAVAPTRD